MRIELKPFQETAAQRLYRHVQTARRGARDGDLQAIVLSSPTGSGKTVTLTALLEWLYAGFESHSPDHEAVFLWLSDSPELNAQSRDKILRQSSTFRDHQLITIEPPFSQEKLEAGNIYFLNTQKLGVSSLLVKPGDGRDHTIWQTIQNTAAVKSSHFYLIIDEAHRGMAESPRERNQAQTIVQRFVKGYPEADLQPVPIIIGMSATPERFNTLIAGTGRIVYPVDIDPLEVKASGLLKDRIVLYYPDEKQPADWSLLEEAVRRWQKFGKDWQAYCQSQNMEHIVQPALVVQVEDGTDKTLTHTNLDELVRVVERGTGRLPEGAWAHAFQEDKTVEADGQKIRKIEASKIEGDLSAQIVLFKMSLTTGWDCPRAEVMMSFRRAQDHTLIAQLVGRMVRTPLARSIEGHDFLNSVSLYLPHYNEAGLKAILDKLNNPDPDVGPSVQVEEGRRLITLTRAPDKADLFDMLAGLPTYRVERAEKSSNARRLMKLARRLTMLDAIDETANREAKQLVVQTLWRELQRLGKDPNFVGNLAANQEIEAREVWVEYGEWKEPDETRVVRLKASPENIDDLFEHSGRLLGEGLHMEFWKAHSDAESPHRAKLQLYGVLQDKSTHDKLERVCKERIDELFKKHNKAIRRLPTGTQELYWRIKRTAKEPEAETPLLPLTIEVRREEPRWERHLFIEEDGKFGTDFDQWEIATLKTELAKPEVVGWLRNVPRQPWALGVPYKMGDGYRTLYPDFIIFRRAKGQIVVDILDPHTPTLADAMYKAKGLAQYAEKDGVQFGRIEIIALGLAGQLQRLNVNDRNTREKIMNISQPAHLIKLFDEQV